MLKFRHMVFISLLRLPFFLVVYSFLLVFSQDDPSVLLLTVLPVYILFCLLETLVANRGLIVVLYVCICAVFILLRQPMPAIMSVCSILYRANSYSNAADAVWIICLCLSILLARMIVPALSYICVRNVLTATVASMLARQVQEFDRFLDSYYCRQVSRKTAVSLIRRSYKMTVVFLSCIMLLGLVLARPAAINTPVEDNGPDVGIISPGQRPAYPSPDEVDNRPALPQETTPKEDLPGGGDILVKVLTSDTVRVIMYGAAAIVALCLIIYLFYSIQKRTALNFEDFDEAVEEEPAEIDTMVRKRVKYSRYGINETVRRLFRSKVQEYIVTGELNPKRGDTPGKLADTISRREYVEPLKQLYHKARYSGEKVSRAELNALYEKRGSKEYEI